MTRSITISSEGDYQKLSLNREEGSQWVDMTFKKPNGTAYASFKAEDMAKVLNLLRVSELRAPEGEVTSVEVLSDFIAQKRDEAHFTNSYLASKIGVIGVTLGKWINSQVTEIPLHGAIKLLDILGYGLYIIKKDDKV